MATRRLISKRARIALYAALCFVVWSICTVVLLAMFQAHADQRIDEMQRNFEDRLRGVADQRVADQRSGVLDQRVADQRTERLTVDDVPRYIVLGHGRSKRFGYLDIQYVCDGEVDRFIYRPETVAFVVDDIERELFRHENGLTRRRVPSSNSLENGDFYE